MDSMLIFIFYRQKYPLACLLANHHRLNPFPLWRLAVAYFSSLPILFDTRSRIERGVICVQCCFHDHVKYARYRTGEHIKRREGEKNGGKQTEKKKKGNIVQACNCRRGRQLAYIFYLPLTTLPILPLNLSTMASAP